MTLELEFTVEPFESGAPGPHVLAAEEAARSGAGELTVGPFGTKLAGDDAEVLAAIAPVVGAAVAAGATRVTLQLTVGESAAGPGAEGEADGRRRSGRAPLGAEAGAAETGARELIGAVRPVVEALGAQLVAASEAAPMDVGLVWEGEVVGAVRPPDLNGAFTRLLDRVAAELGAPLGELSREEKQRAVELLDQLGAFNFRKSVEEAAQALQVSRFTVYNYLSRIFAERPGEERPPGRRPASGRGPRG